MTVLVLGLVVFLGLHSVAIVAPGWRIAMIDRIGVGRWKGSYSVVAAVGLVLIVVGYGMARMAPVVVWSPPAAMRHLALLVMLPVFPLLLAAYLPGRIKQATKHPMLLAVKLWALAHLLANGMLGDIVLFGALLVWAIADRVSVKRRPQVTVHGAPAAPPRAANDTIAVAAGLGIYAILVFGLHRVLFGVAPIG